MCNSRIDVQGLMTAQCGASVVAAVEVVADLAETAVANAAANGLSHRFHVLHTHSTALKELAVPGVGRMQPSVIVGELLDTGLIGEGAIASTRHALSTFLPPHADVAVIPCAATVHCEVVESPWLWHLHSAGEAAAALGLSLPVHPSVGACAGSPSGIAISLGTLHASGLVRPLTHTCNVMRVDFAHPPGKQGDFPSWRLTDCVCVCRQECACVFPLSARRPHGAHGPCCEWRRRAWRRPVLDCPDGAAHTRVPPPHPPVNPANTRLPNTAALATVGSHVSCPGACVCSPAFLHASFPSPRMCSPLPLPYAS